MTQTVLTFHSYSVPQSGDYVAIALDFDEFRHNTIKKTETKKWSVGI